ncbi:type IV pilin [Salinirubellus salinus]|uniref:Type IV pilin n=1 Tax=Salinirubellus salinus TaxID=1364945 RepID=A0A9E7UAU5_9EURY|nr:type IV pilin [Salinirubellus salinus]UWM54407.1 type IV pilin [Salinirubellus salinus]
MTGRDGHRAQANVVGVALLLGVAVVSLGTLTAAVGTVVEDHTARTDTARVATDLDAALGPVTTTGRNRGRVSFAEGTLRTVERDLRVLDGDGVVERVRVGALVYERPGGGRVAFLGGALVSGRGRTASLVTPLPMTASRGSAEGDSEDGDDGDGGGDAGVLVVGAARLGPTAASVSGGGTVTLRTDVRHHRTDLGTGAYRVAVETRTPVPLAESFRERGATVTTRDLDGDGLPSVVASFDGERRAYLVVHDLSLEVDG